MGSRSPRLNLNIFFPKILGGFGRGLLLSSQRTSQKRIEFMRKDGDKSLVLGQWARAQRGQE